MKNKKLLLIIAIFMVSISIFTGCSSVSYGIVQYADGQILQSISINLDKTELEEKGYDVTEKQIQIKDILEDLFTNLKNDFILRMASNQTICEQVLSGVKKASQVDQDSHTIVLQLLFNNITNYKYFYNIQASTDNENIVTEYPFYNVITTKTHTQFYNYKANPYYQDAEQKVIALFKEGDFTIQDVNFNYCYGLPVESKYTSNADYVVTQNGTDIHIWKLKSDELNKEIEFYRLQVKPLLWYVLAVALTLILLVILVIIVIVKKFTNKNKVQYVEDVKIEENESVNKENLNLNATDEKIL